jgi:hypothetical protein
MKPVHCENLTCANSETLKLAILKIGRKNKTAQWYIAECRTALVVYLWVVLQVALVLCHREMILTEFSNERHSKVILS